MMFLYYCNFKRFHLKMFLHYFTIRYKLELNVFCPAFSSLTAIIPKSFRKCTKDSATNIWLEQAPVQRVWKSKCTGGKNIERTNRPTVNKAQSKKCWDTKRFPSSSSSIFFLFSLSSSFTLRHGISQSNFCERASKQKKVCHATFPSAQVITFRLRSYWYVFLSFWAPNHRIYSQYISDVMIWKCALAKS